MDNLISLLESLGCVEGVDIVKEEKGGWVGVVTAHSLLVCCLFQSVEWTTLTYLVAAGLTVSIPTLHAVH